MTKLVCITPDENNKSHEMLSTSRRPKPVKNEKLYNRMRDRKDKRLYEEGLNETDQEEEGVFCSGESNCATK